MEGVGGHDQEEETFKGERFLTDANCHDGHIVSAEVEATRWRL